MLKLCVRCCSAMLLDLCFKMPPPQKHQDFKWVLASYVGPIWGASARIEAWAPDWGQVWPSWTMLRYLEATALFLGKVGAKWGHVRSCWSYMPDLFGPCGWFCTQKWTKILSGFVRAMLVPFGGQVRRPYGYVGAILGPTSAILGYIWVALKANRIKSKIANSAKTLTYMAVKAKRNQTFSQNPPSKRSPQWPCSLNLLRG